MFLNDTTVGDTTVTTVKAVLSLDNVDSKLEAVPLSSNASSFNFGTVSDKGGKSSTGRNIYEVSSTIATIVAGLGYSEGTQQNLSDATAGLIRFAAADVDGNGKLDWEENKNFDLYLNYSHLSEQNFAALNGAYADPKYLWYKGYMYYFRAPNNLTSTDKWAEAYLTSPDPITGKADGNIDGAPVTQTGPWKTCWSITTDMFGTTYRALDFFCGAWATDPPKPPQGIYTIKYHDNSTGDAEVGVLQTLTIKDMRSRAIDLVNGGNGTCELTPKNIFIPVPKLTMSLAGKVTKIEYKFMYHNGSQWKEANDEQVKAQIEYASYEIGTEDYAGATRVNGSFFVDNANATALGSATPPTQGWTPGYLYLAVMDKSGYWYDFQWHVKPSEGGFVPSCSIH